VPWWNLPRVNDLDIRLALLTYLQRQHAHQPDTLVVEEVNVCRGQSRVDLAVVSQGLHGYEIKSQRDSLSRLASQLQDYNCVFDQVTVVIGLKHLSGVLAELPSWCGIILASWEEGQVVLEPFREARPNLFRNPYSLAQLLWREEALEILERHQILRGVKSKPREALWERLASGLALDDLGREVCRALKARGASWRALARPRGGRRRRRRAAPRRTVA
jgi:hypothetical protein